MDKRHASLTMWSSAVSEALVPPYTYHLRVTRLVPQLHPWWLRLYLACRLFPHYCSPNNKPSDYFNYTYIMSGTVSDLKITFCIRGGV